MLIFPFVTSLWMSESIVHFVFQKSLWMSESIVLFVFQKPKSFQLLQSWYTANCFCGKRSGYILIG